MKTKYYLRAFVYFLLFSFLFIGFSPALEVTRPAQAQTTIEEARRSIVRIRVVRRGTNPVNARNRGNLISDGSGFVIGDTPPFQYIGTSWNVVRAANSDVYVWISADDFVPATIYVSLEQSNIALLRLDPDHHLHPYEPLRIGDRSNITVGDDIYALGFPRDSASARFNDVSVVKSVYSRARGLNYVLEDRVQINSDVEGGPLLNKDGVVVGIALRDIPGVPAGTSGGVDVLALVEILQGRGIAYLRPGQPGTTGEASEEAPSAPEPTPLSQVGTPGISDQGVIGWQGVSDARGYEITLFLDGAPVHSGRVGADSTSINLANLMDEYGPGLYTAQVKAIGGGEFLDGPVSSSSNTLEKKSGMPLLFLGLGGGAALLIIIIAIVATQSGSKKKALPQTPVAGPVTQKSPTPATQAKSEPAAAVTRAKPSQPMAGLKGISGQFAGKTIQFVDNQLVIGRDPRLSQLVYPQSSEEISRKHLAIRYDERSNKFILEDSSSNGTYLSSKQKLESGKPYYLNTGDRFYLADPKEVFELRME